MTTAVSIEGVSKLYQLGKVGHRTLAQDLNRWWARFRGRPDPNEQVGLTNAREQTGGTHVWAIQDIDLKIDQGEVFGIVGRNGAGKSTLLKLLSRVTAPTKGVIRARGRIASLLEVGTGFHPELTGRENVFLNGALLGMSRKQISKRLESIVEFSGCAKYIDTPVKRYSSGMKVRLGFAVAAHLDCEILIVDEVLAVGDAEFQKKCLGKLNEVGERGRTILFVSHNMVSVKALCTRCAVMEQGGVSFTGDTNEAIELYNRYSAPGSIGNTWKSESTPEHAHIQSAELLQNGAGVDVINAGEGFSIKIQVAGGAESSKFYLGVVLFDAMGTRIFGCHSRVTGQSPFSVDANQSTIIDFHLPSLNLNPGRFNLNLAYEEVPSSRSIERIENALQLCIEPADVFGTGKIPGQSSICYFKPNWEQRGLPAKESPEKSRVA